MNDPHLNPTRNDDIDNDDVWPLIQLYVKTNGFASHQIDSYNNFIDELVGRVIEQNSTIEINHSKINEKTIVKFGKWFFTKPSFTEVDNEKKLIYPTECRHRGITYDTALHVDIHIEKANGEILEYPSFFMGKIPVMTLSKMCNISDLDQEEIYKKEECPKDIGGIFIVDGDPKVVISQERTSFNKPYIFKNRKAPPCFEYFTEIRSSAVNGSHTTTTQVGFMKEKLFSLIPYIPEKNPIPVGILFKALGVVEEKEIITYITENQEYIDALTPSLEQSYPCRSQEDALLYIGRKGKKFSSVKSAEDADDLPEPDECEFFDESDDDDNPEAELVSPELVSETPEEKERRDAISYAKHLLKVELFPHIGENFDKKKYYLGELVCSLLKIIVEKQNYSTSVLRHSKKWEEIEKELIEDRDHYGNKRIDTVGYLMYNLFYVAWKKLRNDCKLNCEKLLIKGNRDINPINFIKNITITNKMYSCLKNGNWSSNKSMMNAKKNGVSQPLEKLNYNCGLANTRKTNAPIGAKGKIIEPRRLHPSGYGFICPFDTPEGKSAGLLKNIALTTYISVGYDATDMIELIKEMDNLIPFTNTSKYLNHCKVIVNGDWIGFIPSDGAVDVAMNFYLELKEMKRSCNINWDTGIIYDLKKKQIRISTDSGRLMRPLLTVGKDGLVLNKECIEKIEKDEMKWLDLLEQGIVEMVDAEEQDQPNCVIANYPSEILTTSQMKYTYCELHPSMLFGVGVATIPFPNHNQAPRISYQCIHHEEPVFMADGSVKMIKDVNIGDEVITVNPKTLKSETTKIVNKMVRKTDKKMYKIELDMSEEDKNVFFDANSYRGVSPFDSDSEEEGPSSSTLPFILSSLIVTNDHKFLTNEGWKTIEEIFLSNLKNPRNKLQICILEENEISFFNSFVADYYIRQLDEQNEENWVADITTSSSNHSFVAGRCERKGFYKRGFVVHNCNMAKQSIGIPFLNYRSVMDGSFHILNYPQRPLVSSKVSKLIGNDQIPSGQNAIVAIMPFQGFRVEPQSQ